MNMLAQRPLAFRPCSYLTHSLNMSSLDVVDNIPPDVLGTHAPYRTARSCAWGSAFLFATKVAESPVLRTTLRQPSHCSANIYPKS